LVVLFVHTFRVRLVSCWLGWLEYLIKVYAAMSAGLDIATTGLQIDIQLMRRA